MPAIHVFEPALCCNTGVCGPDPAQELVTFTADLAHLKSRGADITRHNLASDVRAFADSAVARSFLQLAGSEGLPLVVVDGVTVLTGRYPTRDELVRWAGLASEGSAASASTDGAAECCGSAPATESRCCDPSSDECCRGQQAGDTQCCDPSSNDCCGDQPAGNTACCDPSSNDCCGDQPAGDTACCDPSSNDCCGDQPAGDTACCDPSSDECCRGQQAGDTPCCEPATDGCCEPAPAGKSCCCQPSPTGASGCC